MEINFFFNLMHFNEVNNPIDKIITTSDNRTSTYTMGTKKINSKSTRSVLSILFASKTRSEINKLNLKSTLSKS